MKRICVLVDHPGGVNSLVDPLLRIMADDKAELTVVSHVYADPILAAAKIPFKKLADFGLSDVSVASMEKLLSAVKPDLVIVGNGAQEEPPIDVIGQTAVVAARKLGIKSMSVLDTPAGYSARWTDKRTGKHLDCLPDIVTALDQGSKAEMVAEGFPEDRVVVTGNPYFDGFVAKAQQFSQEQRDELRQKINLPCQTLFLAALDAFSTLKEKRGFSDADILKILIETLPQLPGVGIVVTTHPRSPDKEATRRTVEASGMNMKFVEGVPSWQVALVADLTIVEMSTVGLEAVLMRRPVISLQPNLKSENELVVSKLGLVPTAFTSQEGKDLLLNAADPNYREKLLEQSAGFKTDGKATERVVQLIYSLLKP